MIKPLVIVLVMNKISKNRVKSNNGVVTTGAENLLLSIVTLILNVVFFPNSLTINVSAFSLFNEGSRVDGVLNNGMTIHCCSFDFGFSFEAHCWVYVHTTIFVTLEFNFISFDM